MKSADHAAALENLQSGQDYFVADKDRFRALDHAGRWPQLRAERVKEPERGVRYVWIGPRIVPPDALPVEAPEVIAYRDPLREMADEIAFLMQSLAPVAEPEAPLLPAPDALMSDYGPVGTDDITGDLLLDAFEENEAETAAIVQTLSALRLKHLSEQLNVERARLDREHQATGVANPRSASIDRLLGLLTRRGEV